LEIFYRFPNSDVLKPYTSDIALVALLTFQDDNEDNAMIALRILFDVHKIYRPLPESSVQVNLIVSIYCEVNFVIIFSISVSFIAVPG